jgi:glycosyltransferase involved in cell wall biosynthesis
MTKSKVSIIIPHYNGIEVLSECLDSLFQSTYPNIEVIVVDNGSSDDSVDWLKINHSQVIVIENDKNLGYAGGCNTGALAASGEYLLFLNNDTIHNPDFVELLADFLDLNSKVAAVQPKILNYFHKDQFDYAGGAGGWLDVLGYPFARGRVFLECEIDSGQYDKIRPIFWASGTAIMVRKMVFDAVDGFDSVFFAHQEEIDLCWKFYHRNSLLMVLTNFSLPLTLYITPIRFSLEFVAILYSLIYLDLKHFFGILHALFWIFLHPHVIFRRRKLVKKIRRIKDKRILRHMYWGSIVFDYYLRKKTLSSDIISE